MKKTAVITGSTQGIGLACAKELLENGYDCFLNYCKNVNKSEKAKEELTKKYNGKFEIIQSDLSNVQGADLLFHKIKEKCEKIDVLVLNAGTTCRGSLNSISYNDWMAVMNTNLNIPFELVRLFNTSINEGGRIIFISSVLGKFCHSVSLPYNVSKAACSYLAKSLVKEFCERKITVNSVLPGFCNTDWQIEKPDDIRKSIEKKIACHRFCEPYEVARAVMFLVDNEYMNGAELQIDGGYCYY